MKINEELLYDIAIIGGGVVGSALALALVQSGFQVLIIESRQLLETKYIKPDIKILSITLATINFLRKLKVWQNIDKRFYTSFNRLETWELSCAKVIFEASSLNLKELGFMIEQSRLIQSLWNEFKNYNKLKLYSSVKLKNMIYNGDTWQLILNNNQNFLCRLLVGADGRYSWVRQKVGIAITEWQYRQSCLLISIKTKKNQQNVTWQELHPSGARAFLPLYNNWASLVWYDDINYIRQLEELNLLELTKKVKIAFPPCLGQFTIYDRAAFSIAHQHAKTYIKPGLVLIGDAAHTIHPLAGQGVNLGLLDAKVLADILLESRALGEVWYMPLILQRYQKKRRKNNLLMQIAIDAFYTTFSNNFLPLTITRNFAMIIAQRSKQIKKLILRYALGL